MSEGYLGNDRLKRVGVELSYTEEQIKEIIKLNRHPINIGKTEAQIMVDKYFELEKTYGWKPII